MAWALWISGLPGSGKSTIAKELAKKIKDVHILRLDEIRRQIVPKPTYTKEERDYVYRTLAQEGAKRVAKGENIILDATAHRKAWRSLARSQIKDFMEVYVKCDLETCIKRESDRKKGLVMADLYKKALDRKRTGRQYEGLGEVVGVDVPYEESEAVEVVIQSNKISAEGAAEIILEKIKEKGWV